MRLGIFFVAKEMRRRLACASLAFVFCLCLHWAAFESGAIFLMPPAQKGAASLSELADSPWTWLPVAGLGAPGWAAWGAFKSWEQGVDRQRRAFATVGGAPPFGEPGWARWVAKTVCVSLGALGALGWGSACLWGKSWLVRMGMTSAAPRQRSTWAMRGARIGIACLVCSVPMAMAGWAVSGGLDKPSSLMDWGARRGLSLSSGAKALAGHGLLP